jgi:putative ABC transport system ATP-binding protein
MMNIIGCLDTPTKGDVFFKNQDLSELVEDELANFRGRKVGFIFQQYNLINKMTAFENVLLPMEFLEFDEVFASKRVEEVLKLVDLESKMGNLPTELSGGQQQRISIARSLVANPDIILADEPTGALDSKTGENVLHILENLWKEQKKTIVMITHDLKLAEFANTIIELKDGKIISEKRNRKVKL